MQLYENCAVQAFSYVMVRTYLAQGTCCDKRTPMVCKNMLWQANLGSAVTCCDKRMHGLQEYAVTCKPMLCYNMLCDKQSIVRRRAVWRTWHRAWPISGGVALHSTCILLLSPIQTWTSTSTLIRSYSRSADFASLPGH